MSPDLPAWQPFDPGADPVPSALLGDRPGGEVVVLAAGGGDEAREWTLEVVSSLAGAWASRSERLFLMDLDLESPGLHRLFSVDNEEGVTDVFLFGSSIQRVARSVEIDGEAFYFASAGTATAEPEGVLEHERWDRLLHGFRDAGARLLLYLPLSASGASSVLAHADRVVALGPEERTRSLLSEGVSRRVEVAVGPPEAGSRGSVEEAVEARDESPAPEAGERVIDIGELAPDTEATEPSGAETRAEAEPATSQAGTRGTVVDIDDLAPDAEEGPPDQGPAGERSEEPVAEPIPGVEGRDASGRAVGGEPVEIAELAPEEPAGAGMPGEGGSAEPGTDEREPGIQAERPSDDAVVDIADLAPDQPESVPTPRAGPGKESTPELGVSSEEPPEGVEGPTEDVPPGEPPEEELEGADPHSERAVEDALEEAAASGFEPGEGESAGPQPGATDEPEAAERAEEIEARGPDGPEPEADGPDAEDDGLEEGRPGAGLAGEAGEEPAPEPVDSGDEAPAPEPDGDADTSAPDAVEPETLEGADRDEPEISKGADSDEPEIPDLTGLDESGRERREESDVGPEGADGEKPRMEASKGGDTEDLESGDGFADFDLDSLDALDERAQEDEEDAPDLTSDVSGPDHEASDDAASEHPDLGAPLDERESESGAEPAAEGGGRDDAEHVDVSGHDAESAESIGAEEAIEPSGAEADGGDAEPDDAGFGDFSGELESPGLADEDGAATGGEEGVPGGDLDAGLADEPAPEPDEGAPGGEPTDEEDDDFDFGDFSGELETEGEEEEAGSGDDEIDLAPSFAEEAGGEAEPEDAAEGFGDDLVTGPDFGGGAPDEDDDWDTEDLGPADDEDDDGGPEVAAPATQGIESPEAVEQAPEPAAGEEEAGADEAERPAEADVEEEPSRTSRSRSSGRALRLTVLLVLVAAGAVAAHWFGLVRVPGLDRALASFLGPAGTGAAPVVETTGTPPETPILGYSLEVDAYRDVESAEDVASALRERLPGRLFVVAPVQVDGEVLHRLLAGPARSAQDAADLRAPLSEVLTRENPDAWQVRPTSLAFVIAEASSLGSGRSRASTLQEQGIPAYVLRVDDPAGTTRYRVYAGAYETPEEARALQGILSQAGIGDVTFTERRGRVPE